MIKYVKSFKVMNMFSLLVLFDRGVESFHRLIRFYVHCDSKKTFDCLKRIMNLFNGGLNYGHYQGVP